MDPDSRKRTPRWRRLALRALLLLGIVIIVAPAALVLNRANPIMAQGAAFAGLTFMDRFDVDITEALSTGNRVTVNPVAGTLIVHD